MKKIIATLTMLMVVGSLSACNTIAGVGKDVRAGGSAIEHTANDAKK